MFLRKLPLLLLLLLPACEPAKIPKHKQGEYLATTDKPIAFKKRTVGYIKRSQELGKYVCQTLDSQLQDRFIVHKEYSAEFILKTLREVPQTMRDAYGACYLEGELKEIGFKDYFSINKGFLGEQALAHYKAIGALPEIKILIRAFDLALQKPKNAKQEQQIWKALAELDKAWAKRSQKELETLRGEYARRMLASGDWPTKEK